MANSLLITKLSDDSFSFVVNGDVVNTITNLRNDITTVGNEIHVKTSEGANLIKLQKILYNEVTIVDGATLPVATSPLDLRIKLRSVGFWDWLTLGGGGGVDRFDELSDTFAYFGNDGKIPMVDESQLKLIAFSLPDTSYLNLFPSPLQPLKALRANAAGDAYEFYDTVNIVTQEIRPGYTETAPSEDVVYNSLELKLDSGGYSGTGQDLKNELDVKTENSAGAIQGFAVTNNGNGTVNIASGTAFLRATNDQYAPLVKYTIPAVTNLALTDNANNYVLVDYNGGTPALTVTTNGATINTETNSLAIFISRVGTVLDWLSLVGQNNDSNAKLRVRFLNQEGIRRANGAVIGFSNRNLTLTAGTLFSGLIRINSPAFNTATPDTFTYVYNNGAVWTRVTGQTQVNNTQYNNGGILTTMPGSDFRTDYVYLLPNNPSKLYVVYGTTTYANITLARNAPTPASLPSELQVLGLLVGRQIIQRNAPSISEVTSAFTDVFAGVGVPEHNALAGLQGGSVNDYQHLTTAQLNGLIQKNTIAQIRAFSGTLSNTLFYTTDLDQEGNWYYDASDTTSADNTGTILVTSDGKRIKRAFNNTILPEWFGAIGDGTTNDGTAIQNTINAAIYGNEIEFNTTKTYLSSALTLKSDVALIGNSVNGVDHTQTQPKLKYSGTTGDFLTLVSGASSPYSPTKGVSIKNLTIDGNNTTGALIKIGTFRSVIQGCNLTNASNIIYYPNTTGWIGENRIKSNNIYTFTDAIYSEGIYGLDGHIEDNFIFTGTRGIFLTDAAGWDIHGNHLYGITGTNIEVSGVLFNIRNNYLDNIDTIGIKATVTSAVSGSVIQSNIISNTATNNSVGIDIISTSTGKVLISGNTIYAATALTGTTGIRTTGAATFFGSILNNLVDQLDTPYSLHSANNTDFTEVKSNRLLMNGNEIRFEHNGQSSWGNSLMAQSVAPETVYSANAGTLGINRAGSNGTVWVKLTGTGNTGWEQIFSGKATASKTGAMTLAGDLGGSADVPTVIKLTTTLPASAGGYQLVSKNTTTGAIESITSGFYSKTDNPVFTTRIATPELLINASPATSAGTYDIITRNSSTGVLEKIPSSSIPVQPLRYKAFISQTGTSAPVVTILENTLGTVTYSYIGVGVYTANSSALFTANKTFIMVNPAYGNGNVAAAKTNTSSIIDIRSGNGLVPTDGILSTFILIEVYP